MEPNILKLVIITTYLLQSYIWKQRYRELTYGIQMTDEGFVKQFSIKITIQNQIGFSPFATISFSCHLVCSERTCRYL